MAWDYDYTDGADIIDAIADEWKYCSIDEDDDDYDYDDDCHYYYNFDYNNEEYD